MRTVCINTVVTGRLWFIVTTTLSHTLSVILNIFCNAQAFEATRKLNSLKQLLPSKKIKMTLTVEEILFLASLVFLVLVIFAGVIAMCLAKAKRMSDAAIEDIERRMASYEETSELVHGEFTEYLETAIHDMQQQAIRMMPRRILTADAATDTSIPKTTMDGTSQTDTTTPAPVGAVVLQVRPVPAAEITERAAPTVPAAGGLEPQKTVSLPTVIEVKPAVHTQSSIRFIGSHPVI